VLPSGRQRLTADGRFRYLGGELPLPTDWHRRAEQLAQAVLAALPATTGYIGIDLVLGHACDGRHDVVIEVNPRLTTSYVGLRKIARGNLAAAMLQIAGGVNCELSFDPQPLTFTPEWDPGELACRG
jgi:predicted ATP-grasp superfamily ATP-dependent carboligase